VTSEDAPMDEAELPPGDEGPPHGNRRRNCGGTCPRIAVTCSESGRLWR
jgi:hypothetical protein